MQRINEDNFSRVNPEILKDPRWYQDVEDTVLSIAGAEDAPYARDFAVTMVDKLAVVGNKMPKDLFARYLRLLKILRLLGLRAVTDAEKEKYFREQVLDCVRAKVLDIKEKVDYLFRSFFETPDIIEEWRKMFVRGMEQNNEILGNFSLTVDLGAEKKVLKPTLQNWILDYNTNAHVNPTTKKRSGYEQTNYILHSPNVAKLTKEEKEILVDAIQLYDWLRFDPLRYNFSLPGQKVPQEEGDFVYLEKPEPLISPELIQKLEEMRKAHSGQKHSEDAAQRYITKQQATMPESLAEPAGEPEAQAQEPEEPQQPIEPVQPTPPPVQMFQPKPQQKPQPMQPDIKPLPAFGSVKPQFVPKSQLPGKAAGTGMRPSSNDDSFIKTLSPQEIKRQMEEKRKQQQNRIDKKLEELSARVKGKYKQQDKVK